MPAGRPGHTRTPARASLRTMQPAPALALLAALAACASAAPQLRPHTFQALRPLQARDEELSQQEQQQFHPQQQQQQQQQRQQQVSAAPFQPQQQQQRQFEAGQFQQPQRQPNAAGFPHQLQLQHQQQRQLDAADFHHQPQPQVQRPAVRPGRLEDEARLAEEQSANAHYSFLAEVDDGVSDLTHHRQETRDGHAVTGSFSYSDGFLRRTVKYVADENGYRVLSDEAEPLPGPQQNLEGVASVHTHVDGHDLSYRVQSVPEPAAAGPARRPV